MRCDHKIFWPATRVRNVKANRMVLLNAMLWAVTSLFINTASANLAISEELSSCYLKAIVVSNGSAATQDDRTILLGYGELVGVEPDNLWGLSAIFSEIEAIAVEAIAKAECSNLDDKALELGKQVQAIKQANRKHLIIEKFSRLENGVEIWIKNETDDDIKGLVADVFVKDAFGEETNLFALPKYIDLPTDKLIQFEHDFGGYLTSKETEFLAAPVHSLNMFIEAKKILSAADLVWNSQEVTTPPSKQSEPVTTEEIKLLRNHLSSCWQQPAGLAGEDLRVDLLIKLDKVGGVIEVEVEDNYRYSLDKAFRSFANAAVRAVHDCQPLPMPVGKYDHWKEMFFSFHPSQM